MNTSVSDTPESASAPRPLLSRWAPRGWLTTLALALSSPALAQQAITEPPAEDESNYETEPELTPEERIAELEDRLEELTQKLQQTEKSQKRSGPVLTFGGYVDVGFFVPGGNNGAGFVEDVGNQAFPQFAGQYGWTFLGDILATPVNSRGEAADLGDAAGVRRMDLIHARGAPGFLVNEVNLRATAGLTDRLLLTASVNFAPRSGATEFSLGDTFDVDIAQLEWLPFADGKTSVFVGKFDSVVGIEYRERKASQRFGITPSLLARYTSGTPIGLKVRTKLMDEHIVVAAAITNGTSSTEQFHFYTETDTNWGKTLSGRVSGKFTPVAGELEVGVSGEYGPQGHALGNNGIMYLVGVDGIYRWKDLLLKAQFLRGFSPGNAVDRAYGLKLHRSGYLEANYMFTPTFGALGRAEFRDAFVDLTDERAYLTKSWRATVGGRAALTENIVVKAEYLFNGEYGGIPDIRNNMFTSSLLVTY
ncbi:hypothetical protein P2318_09930 [Myxococcaceae bacterium GXIMD 01537]